jgi:hypothetical protein
MPPVFWKLIIVLVGACAYCTYCTYCTYLRLSWGLGTNLRYPVSRDSQ